MLKKLVERYLRFLTGIVIYRHQPDIIAIAGITSKTTTKKYIVDHLRQIGLDVRANPKSYNTEIGLPLAVLYVEVSGYAWKSWLKTIWQCTTIALFSKRFPKILVLEFGVSGVGDMKHLLNIVKPRIAVFTNIRPSDFNPNTTIDELNSEMLDLMKVILNNGLVIYNWDDNNLRALANQFSGQKISYGIGEGADIQATNIQQHLDGLSWAVYGQKRKTIKSGLHHIYAELAADAVARSFK